MISLLPMGQVIGFVSVVYAVVIALVAAISWKFGDQSQTLWGSIGFAFSGGTVLQLALMGWFYFGWRWLWKKIPALSRLLFPDIGGEWDIKISWQGHDHSGAVEAKATIKQDFLRFSMEVASRDSDSQSLIAQPKKDPESGRPILYYIYLVIPKALGPNPTPAYYGAAILRFSEARGGQLSGNYWTNQQTTGHFRLVRRT